MVILAEGNKKLIEAIFLHLVIFKIKKNNFLISSIIPLWSGTSVEIFTNIVWGKIFYLQKSG